MKKANLTASFALAALMSFASAGTYADDKRGAGDGDSNWMAHVQSTESRANVEQQPGAVQSGDVATYHEANSPMARSSGGHAGHIMGEQHGKNACCGMNAPAKSPSAAQSSDIGGPFTWGG